MSDFTKVIGDIERIKSVSAPDHYRLKEQVLRLGAVASNLYVFNGREDANV